ncbi:MAG TPA: GNAT family N-acetyltransferase [Streptosporangiaceae bacterium]|jgi:GNAT superfamily N-acetyltransferase
MQLEQFDPATDIGQVRACYDMFLAGAPVDDPHAPPPSLRGFRGWLRYGWSEDPSETWLARDIAGAPCGWFVLILPQRENRSYAYVELFVHPARRRAGLGRALAGHAAARAVRSGRTLLNADTGAESAGAAFARAIGAREGMTDIRRILRLATLSSSQVAGLRGTAQAAASGYSLLCWEGPVPAEHAAAIAAVTNAADDMPTDAGLEAQRWDAARVQQTELRILAQGMHYYTVVARHDASGELVGYTQLGLDPLVPEWGYQELTAVARPHRGHRLGMLVKIGMLDLLAAREPQLRHIITGNADSNEHMVAINEALGFEPLDRWTSWEMDAAAAVMLRDCA